ncbi:lysozyme inhibitor LprI family protein [Azospirillum griseum]|uniref:DUF1311 domain-containing protein n=1 Tax=Azospirillum griseum TaxID=2496639 RepID=A0A431VML7_9PROT|nr:lysozyme inhibitor LprI family protein [Azospirillum griseum]RTR23557.1 DUF1311 domain-containing protein [Azospirillum griseum]
MTTRTRTVRWMAGTALLSVTLCATVGTGQAADGPGLAQRVLAQPAEPRPKDCDANMLSLKICAAAEFRQADKALNTAYQAARKEMPDDKARALLLDAQRAWLKYRDAMCEWEGDGLYRDGSMSGLVILNCLTRVTTEQAKALDNAIKP